MSVTREEAMLTDDEILRSAGLLLRFRGFKPSSEPAAHLIEAAMRAVPACIQKLIPNNIRSKKSSRYKIPAEALIKDLAGDHPGPATAFAVFRLIQSGRLGAEIQHGEVPEGKFDATDWLGPPDECAPFYVVFENGTHSETFYSLYRNRRDHRLIVWAEPELWDWWRAVPEPPPSANRSMPIRVSPSSKHPVKTFRLLDGLRWDEVTIEFASRDSVRITARGESKTFMFSDIGFADGRKGDRPDSQWDTLYHLAQRHGELAWSDYRKGPINTGAKTRIKEIRKRLRAVMQIEDDPFESYRKVKAYKTKFALHDGSCGGAGVNAPVEP
jgi:hypothetical protein